MKTIVMLCLLISSAVANAGTLSRSYSAQNKTVELGEVRKVYITNNTVLLFGDDDGHCLIESKELQKLNMSSVELVKIARDKGTKINCILQSADDPQMRQVSIVIE